MQQNIDITTYSIEQLEALGYRAMKELNLMQQNLTVIEQTIQKKTQESLTPPQEQPEPIVE